MPIDNDLRKLQMQFKRLHASGSEGEGESGAQQ